MEEILLILATKRGLRTETSDQPYSVTYSDYGDFDGQYYVVLPITIDNHEITVYGHRAMIKGTLEYFYYDSFKRYRRYQLYLSVDAVLENKPFFTTTKAERRKLKLKNIKNKLQNKELIIS